MSREQLKTTKLSLEYETENCRVAMSMFEFYTAFVVGAKMSVLLLVFKDCVAVPCNLTQYKISKEVVGVDNHIQISLNDILQGMFPEMDLQPKEQTAKPIKLEEMQLLTFIGLGVFEKVEVK